MLNFVWKNIKCKYNSGSKREKEYKELQTPRSTTLNNSKGYIMLSLIWFVYNIKIFIYRIVRKYKYGNRIYNPLNREYNDIDLM